MSRPPSPNCGDQVALPNAHSPLERSGLPPRVSSRPMSSTRRAFFRDVPQVPAPSTLEEVRMGRAKNLVKRHDKLSGAMRALFGFTIGGGT
jgi:hypothetical protein